MHRILSFLCFISLLPFFACGQQNHVPNGSFETYTTCPIGSGQINTCSGWTSWNSGSPDYYNSCNTGAAASVPVNWPGYQPAAHGNAYAGIVDIWSMGSHREYLYSQITPLQAGKTYEVSMLVSCSNKCRYGSNGLSVYFFDNGPSYYGATQAIPSVTPQISYASYGPITDTSNWVRLSATFTADSAYDNIVIGGFLSLTQVTTDTFNPSAQYISSYYYIDSVVVKPADTFYHTITDSLLCNGDTFSLQYFIFNNYNSNNVFTAQLSNASGSFNSPINIGSTVSDTSGIIHCTIPINIAQGNGYRIRVVASSPADTSYNTWPVLKIGNPDSTNIAVSSNSPLCEGTTLQLSASTFISGTTYNWTGPNSFNSGSASPTILGAAPLQTGDYIVTMKWYGCEVKDTLAVTVKPLPAGLVVGSNSPLCAGETLNLTATTSTSGVSWAWTGPGSYSSTSQNPSRTNTTTAMSGVYTATATLNGCSSSDTVHVLVNNAPAPVIAGSNSPVCAGDTLHITIGTSTTGVVYSWVGPNSFTANTQNTFVANSTTAATGWYVATLNLNGCIFKDSTQATVHPMPATPTVSYSNPMCVGETLQLNASTVSGATYSWTGVGNYSSTQQNPIRGNMQFSDTGTYSVTASANGCTSPAGSVKVNINPVPFVVIFPTPGDSICVGEQVSFTALPNYAGGTPAYRWYVNGLSAGTGISYTSSALNNQDIVRCDMTESTKCRVPYVDASNDVEMKVLPWLAPSVTISANPNRPLNVDEYVTFTATPVNGGNNPKYQWKRNGQDVQGATGPVWSANTLNDNDSISVELISNYRCPQPPTAGSNGIRVKVLTGVGDVKGGRQLKVYPNPANDYVIFEYTDRAGKGNMQVRVYNALGQKLTETALINDKTIWNTANLSAGVYIYQLLTTEGVSETGRIIISR